jgi:hypothetical protein
MTFYQQVGPSNKSDDAINKTAMDLSPNYLANVCSLNNNSPMTEI